MSLPTQRSGAPPQHPASEETSRHHAADRHQGNGAVVHVPVSSLAAAAEDVELIAEVHGLVDRVVKLAGGHVLQLGSAEWWAAPLAARLTPLLVLAEHWLLRSPDEIAADMLKAASVAISTGGVDWSDVGCSHTGCAHTAHRHLVVWRGEPGPHLRPFDPAAAARWVSTGTSREKGPAA